MTVDVKAVESVLQQAIGLMNLGSTVAGSVVKLVGDVVSTLKAKGYEVDTARLDELVADALKRQAIAEQEKTAER